MSEFLYRHDSGRVQGMEGIGAFAPDGIGLRGRWSGATRGRACEAAGRPADPAFRPGTTCRFQRGCLLGQSLRGCKGIVGITYR